MPVRPIVPDFVQEAPNVQGQFFEAFKISFDAHEVQRKAEEREAQREKERINMLKEQRLDKKRKQAERFAVPPTQSADFNTSATSQSRKLVDELSAARVKWENGEINDDEYLKEESAIFKDVDDMKGASQQLTQLVQSFDENYDNISNATDENGFKIFAGLKDGTVSPKFDKGPNGETIVTFIDEDGTELDKKSMSQLAAGEFKGFDLKHDFTSEFKEISDVISGKIINSGPGTRDELNGYVAQEMATFLNDDDAMRKLWADEIGSNEPYDKNNKEQRARIEQQITEGIFSQLGPAFKQLAVEKLKLSQFAEGTDAPQEETTFQRNERTRGKDRAKVVRGIELRAEAIFTGAAPIEDIVKGGDFPSGAYVEARRDERGGIIGYEILDNKGGLYEEIDFYTPDGRRNIVALDRIQSLLGKKPEEFAEEMVTRIKHGY